MATTQKDIARQLGISQTVVAHALSGRLGVAERTRERVLETAQTMGYSLHDNAAARSLVARRFGGHVKTGVIVALMGDFMDGLSLQNMPFFREILQGIHQEAGQRQLDVAIHLASAERLPRALQNGQVDGVINLYSVNSGQLLSELSSDVPIVNLGNSSGTGWTIVSDDRQGTYLATSHLIELGHRRIGYLSAAGAQPTQMEILRLQGFQDAMDEAGLDIDSSLVLGHHYLPSETSGVEYARELLARGLDCTGLVCAHDSLAVGVVQELQASGVRVPGDVSVTGFDGTHEGYGGSSRLTSAFFDRHKMGRRAVEMLDALPSELSLRQRHEILPVHLLQRASTGPPTLSAA